MEVNEVLLQKIEELEKQVKAITRENEKYRALINAEKLKEANREYKDKLFKFIFGNPENKQWTLSLYNAINGTNYTNPDDITFNTMEDVVYLRMKNDISFIISFVMNLWEHQSSYNPNMPLRFFIYAGELYDKYTITNKYNKFSDDVQKIPVPKCICFYNGEKDQPESQVLRLSDAYDGEGDIEVCVTMLNINYEKNKKLMNACKPLKEYAWSVYTVRNFRKAKINLDMAVDKMIDEMPDDFLIKEFMLENRAEVKMSFLREYDIEKDLQLLREELYEKGYDKGYDDARVEVIKETHNEIAVEMLKNGESLDKVSKYCGISEEETKKLAESLNVDK